MRYQVIRVTSDPWPAERRSLVYTTKTRADEVCKDLNSGSRHDPALGPYMRPHPYVGDWAVIDMDYEGIPLPNAGEYSL